MEANKMMELQTYTEDVGFKDRFATVSVDNDDDKSTDEDTTGGSCT